MSCILYSVSMTRKNIKKIHMHVQIPSQRRNPWSLPYFEIYVYMYFFFNCHWNYTLSLNIYIYVCMYFFILYIYIYIYIYMYVCMSLLIMTKIRKIHIIVSISNFQPHVHTCIHMIYCAQRAWILNHENTRAHKQVWVPRSEKPAPISHWMFTALWTWAHLENPVGTNSGGSRRYILCKTARARRGEACTTHLYPGRHSIAGFPPILRFFSAPVPAPKFLSIWLGRIFVVQRLYLLQAEHSPPTECPRLPCICTTARVSLRRQVRSCLQSKFFYKKGAKAALRDQGTVQL